MREGRSGTYFNDVEPFVCDWLSNLWPEAQVDRRSIAHIAATDLAGFRRLHFFAGIGGWEHALQLAGWPATRPVWTGSCPCQPWSVAGKGKGEADDRHLWPELRRLIAECRPPVVFGEQVASRLGRDWLAGVRADLEALGYAVGAADLCAAGVGAPHIRQRLYWVAYTAWGERKGAGCIGPERRAESANSCGARGVADAQRWSAERYGLAVDAAAGRVQGEAQEREWIRADAGDGITTGGLADAMRAGRAEGRSIAGRGSAPTCGATGGLGHADLSGSQGRVSGELRERSDERAAGPHGPCGPAAWGDARWLPCSDGKVRRVAPEPELFPLAHGIPARVGRLRAYGNAIVPQVAAAFVTAFMESVGFAAAAPERVA